MRGIEELAQKASAEISLPPGRAPMNGGIRDSRKFCEYCCLGNFRTIYPLLVYIYS